MMNSDIRVSRHGLGALARGVTHTLILAALGLSSGLAGLLPSAATAQSESPEPAADVSTPPTEVQQQPGDVQLRVGETASLEGGALQVTMVQVSEDSRCPMDVMCVWMGRAVVGLHVALDGVDRGDVDVTLYPGRPTPGTTATDATVDRYVISLVDLQPYPRAGQPEPLDQRVATIRVTRSQ